MSGATLGTIAVSVAGSVASSAIGGAISGGGGGSAPTVGGGGGGGIQANEQKFYGSDAANTFSGVHVSTNPMAGQKPPNFKEMEPSKAVPARATSAKETPTQADGMSDARSDINNVWADRLSKYLDYNTRALG